MFEAVDIEKPNSPGVSSLFEFNTITPSVGSNTPSEPLRASTDAVSLIVVPPTKLPLTTLYSGAKFLLDVFPPSFVDESSTAVTVYWPSGVAPIVTGLASKTDIYSFKIMDGDGLSSAGLFGVVTCQNFS